MGHKFQGSPAARTTTALQEVEYHQAIACYSALHVFAQAVVAVPGLACPQSNLVLVREYGGQFTTAQL